MKVLYLGALAVLLLAPRDAAAQSFFISPFIDTTLSSPSTSGGHSKAGFGVSLGTLGKFIGSETEIAYHPQILDNSANGLGKSHVLTFSQNMVIGPTIGAVKPYFTVGGGDLHLNVSSVSSLTTATPEGISNNYFTLNLGGGAAYFVRKGIGVRGDLRYFKAYGFDFKDIEASGGLKFNKFTFWRLGFGAQFAF
jgi:opacity protein-like surface antigen